ncbi:TPA: hypothetical protein JAK83_002453 [Corynebacterium striatum]|nr:hypothetical protein [Corynebacterium striatum]
MTNIDKAADLLYQRSKELLGVDSDAAHRACQEHAQALADAGLLTPELPEPNDPGIFVPDGKGWIPGGPHGPSVWTAPGSPIMVQRIEPGDLTSDEARKLAYALLAAANHAEEA